MGAHQPCSIEVSATVYGRSRQHRRRLAIIFVIFFLVIVISLVVALVVVGALKSTTPHCSPGRESRGRDLRKPGLYSDLTPGEMRAVRDFLLGDHKLGLTPIEKAALNSSYIFMIDLQMPLKAAVLGFTDGGRRKPDRAAIAVLYRGDLDPPRVEERIVGPLPSPTYHRLMTNPAYRRSPVPFASRPEDSIERRQLRAFLKSSTRDLHQLIKESYHLSYHDCEYGPKCLMFVDLPPRGQHSGHRRSWFWGYRQVEGAPLHPLGLAIEVDHVSPQVSDWTVLRIVYNGQLFYEIEDLMERYKEDSVRKVRQSMDEYDRGFSSSERRGPHRFDAPGRGPRPVEPDGRRFAVDGQFVTYFGWSFNFRSRTATGLQLFDVIFQDGRIAYEIGLQEAAVFYSGHSPEMSTMTFYGSSWLLGASAHELVPGVDCPPTAHFLDTFHFVDTPSPRRHRHSVCIFEHNDGIPLRRHYTTDHVRGFQYYGGTVAHSLILRSIAVVWNKDIIVDYIFHLDGTLEIRVSTTGYLQASFSLPRERTYGHQVHDDIIGNAFQELFHFKIDLDIAGSENRYKTVQMVAASDSNFWDPSQNSNITKMKFIDTVIRTERESIWKHGSSPLLHHIVYNHRTTNKYRAPRAYRILHRSTTELVLKAAPVAQAAGWAVIPLAVTKYKDVEDSSSSIYAQGDPWDPVVDFRMYLEDNNTIVDDDLVVWATLGAVSLPATEDVPFPTTTVHSYSLLLAPHNFFERCPSAVVSDSVHMVKEGGEGSAGGKTVDTFGTKQEEAECYQREAGVSDFSGNVEFEET